jgi:hypothetical protein
MLRLEHKHTQKGFGRFLWIIMIREKATQGFSIPLQPQVEVLVNRKQSEEPFVFNSVPYNVAHNSTTP